MHTVTIVDLLSDEKYRKMNVDELEYEIDYNLTFNDYTLMAGEWAKGKAEILHAYFRAV
jgi:hypothetical protein